MRFFDEVKSRLPWRKAARLREIVRQQAGNLELMFEELQTLRLRLEDSQRGMDVEADDAALMHVRMAEMELIGGARPFAREAYYAPARESALLVKERMAELELALEDRNWLRLSAETNREFSRQGLRAIMMLSRFFFLKNPLIRRGVLLQSFYVWAQGVNIQAKDTDVNAVLQDFMDDRANRTELFSHQARTEKEQELQVTGNLFFVFFVNIADGHVRLRTIPADEVEFIHSNPEDAKEPWFYERVWNEQGIDPTSGAMTVLAGKTALYPDWRYRPQAKPKFYGEKPILWDSPVCHMRVGGLPDMRFGVPEYYSALDWARAYTEFLTDWCTITRAYRRYAWNLTTSGGQAAVNKHKTKLATTAALGGTSVIDNNPPAVTGATFVHTEGVKLEAFKANAGSLEDGRRVGLMVGSGVGLPETMLMSDIAKGAHATAKTLDRPTELKMRDRQELWADFLMDLFNYVIDWAARAPNGALHGQLDVDKDPAPLSDRLRAQKQDEKEKPVSIDGKPQIDEEDDDGEIDRHIDVDFPAILQNDLTERIGAIVSAATLDGKQLAGTIPHLKDISRMLLQALGQDDIDELLEDWFPTDDEADATGPGPELIAAINKLQQAMNPPTQDEPFDDQEQAA